MSQEKSFLKKIATDIKAKELLKGLKKTSSDEEAAEECVDIAQKLGFDISKEKFLNLFKIKEAIQKKKTEDAEAAVKEALSEGDVESVAGGDSICYDTYLPGENCYFTDECNVVLLSYEEQPAINIPAQGDDECTGSYITYHQKDGWENWIEDFDDMAHYDGRKNDQSDYI